MSDGSSDPDLAQEQDDERSTELQPALKSHILHCSFHYWHPRFRAVTPKARLVPLTRPFVEYLRADGIVLPSDSADRQHWSDSDSGVFSASDNTDAQGSDEDEDEDEDVAAEWRHVHDTIKDTIADLGGKVVPKLNWSSPKDATWMNANTMECRNPNDIYLLLKSSDFVTHDLEHAFDDCIDAPGSTITAEDIPYHLVLRKYISKYNPALEFRCFVRDRKLLCICQRDLQHYNFLFDLQDRFSSLIKEFFEIRIHDAFPDPNFVFDVYIPSPYDRVWLIDFNPWALRTDPLLFSWRELLDMPDPPDFKESSDVEDESFVRIPFSRSPQAPGNQNITHDQTSLSGNLQSLTMLDHEHEHELDNDDDDDSEDEDVDEEIWLPELRLVLKSDPEARNFATPQYSAHKLPKDVVDASQADEGGLREFAKDWENFLVSKGLS